MFARILLLSYFVIFTAVADSPQSLRTAQDEAYEAYDSLYRVATKGFNAVRGESASQTNLAKAKLSGTGNDLIVRVNAKLNTTISRIQAIQDELRQQNITSCNYDYTALIEGMRTSLLNRTNECVDLYSDVFTSLFTNFVAEASTLFNDVAKCHLQSFIACSEFNQNDDCYYFLISNFQKARDVIENTAQFMQYSVVTSRVDSIIPHCEQFITFEMSIWPDYYLQTLNSCAEREFWNSRQTTVCPYDLFSYK